MKAYCRQTLHILERPLSAMAFLLMSYCVLYVSLVRRSEYTMSEVGIGRPGTRVFPVYRVSHLKLQIIFCPIHWADKTIVRPKYWHSPQ